MFIDLASDAYRNLTCCENQSGVFICDHTGPCGRACPCRINKTTCREGCKCPSNCPHRFPYCDCDSCGVECPCRNNGRECIPGKCRGGKCTERCASIYPVKPLDTLTVKKSAIPGAGNGLFTQETIKSHRFIGRYTGDILPDKQVKEFGEREMTAFTISQDMSIQGISPSNWVYWVNHPPAGPPNKANAMFLTIEGPTERFIVLTATKHIYPNTEIFAEYSSDYKGFEGLSADHELWTPDLPDTTEQVLKVGEYVLIKGFVGGLRRTDRMAEVWVGLIAQTYEDDKYGVHWLYHHSHLEAGVRFPECPKGQAPSFEPWELIMSEHTSIVEADKIMTRIEMLERAREPERKVGTWWWDWVLCYDRKYHPTKRKWTNVPVLVSSKTYFKDRVSIDTWDLVLKAKGLTPTSQDQEYQITAQMSNKLTRVRKSKDRQAMTVTKTTRVSKVKSKRLLPLGAPRRMGLRRMSQISETESSTSSGRLPAITRDRIATLRSLSSTISSRDTTPATTPETTRELTPEMTLDTTLDTTLQTMPERTLEATPEATVEMAPGMASETTPVFPPSAEEGAQHEPEVTTTTRKRASPSPSNDQVGYLPYGKRQRTRSYLNVIEILDSEDELDDQWDRELTPRDDRQRDSMPLLQSPTSGDDSEPVTLLNRESVLGDVEDISFPTELPRYISESVHPGEEPIRSVDSVQFIESRRIPSEESVQFIDSRPVHSSNNRLADFDDSDSLHFVDNGPADFDDTDSLYREDVERSQVANSALLRFGDTEPLGDNPVLFNNLVQSEHRSQAPFDSAAPVVTAKSLARASTYADNSTIADGNPLIDRSYPTMGNTSTQSAESSLPTTPLPSVEDPRSFFLPARSHIPHMGSIFALGSLAGRTPPDSARVETKSAPLYSLDGYPGQPQS